MTVVETAAPSLLASTPIPAGRDRWRLTVHSRVFTGGQLPRDTGIAELTDARSRRLAQKWCQPAQLTFTLDGHSPSAQTVQEMTTDVMCWRWDEATGRDVCMFRGIVAQSQDSLSEDVHTVTFTCHDYLSMLSRRFWTGGLAGGWANMDQDVMVDNIVATGVNMTAANNTTSFLPGAFLPLLTGPIAPDGSPRAYSSTLGAPLRTRIFAAQSTMLESIANLAACQYGFDYDCKPGGASAWYDLIRIFYPSQGVQRSSPQLVYGSTVSALSRSFNSADYANYQRVVGNNGTSTPGTMQLFGETWNTDAVTGSAGAQGLWMNGDNASDVSVQQTLNERVLGSLGRSGVVVPSYSITLRPGAYSYGNPNMGDTVPLIVQSGRLKVDTMIRVLGIDYAVGDDGQEDVALTVGRPDVTLANLFTRTNADVDALARR